MTALDKAGYVIADLIIVRDGFAQSYPDAVTGFLKAYGRALDMYRAEARRGCRRSSQSRRASRPAVAQADMKEYDFVPLSRAGRPRPGSAAPRQAGKFAKVLKGTAEFLVEQKSIKSAPGPRGVQKAIDTSLSARRR